MMAGSLARRYARALLGLAPDPVARDKYAKDLGNLAQLLRQDDEAGTNLLTLVAGRRFPLSDRKRLLEALARRVLADAMVIKFLGYVLERDRIGGVPEIARAYLRLADEAAGRQQAEITTATPLAPEAAIRIKSALEKATGKTIVITTKVDPEIIGGVVAKVGSYLIDGSVRANLQRMRASLRT